MVVERVKMWRVVCLLACGVRSEKERLLKERERSRREREESNVYILLKQAVLCFVSSYRRIERRSRTLDGRTEHESMF